MMNSNTNSSINNQAVHVLTVVLTLLFCFGAFHFWFPKHIEEKSALVLEPLEQKLAAVIEDKQKTAVPQDLLDYINELRSKEEQAKQAILEEQKKLQTLEQYEEDYADTARDILANRFKLPQTTNGFNNDDFATPEGIKDRVDFWTHIFGMYTSDHVIFYNAENVGIVYSVLDFSELNSLGGGEGSFKSQTVAEERNRIVKMIRKVSKRLSDKNLKLAGLDKQEQRLARLLLKNNDQVDISAEALINNLKVRNGFSTRIKKSIVESGKYMAEMRRIFRERGLPEELTIIPFIESSFNLNAYSHAGAAGIWQFIEATGRRYLRIDEYVDERFDPILSAYAAATHLAHEYKMLGSWPQTINAYNTGPGRILQAKKQLGTDDISQIIKYYKGSGYGTDSKNYYPEFLAALHVYNNQEQFFGGKIKTHQLEEFEFVALPAPTNLRDLADEAGLSLAKIREMNIALKPEVAAGEKVLPKGYLVKIPKEAKDNVLLALQQITNETDLATHHIIRRGDSLKKVAKMYNVSIDDLSDLNEVFPDQKLKSGDILELPGRGYEYSTMQQSDQLVMPDNVARPVF